MFIKNKSEHNIKNFFLNEIEQVLENYKPGSPENKPDVIENIKMIEQERKKMENTTPTITIQKEGEPSRQMTAQEIIGTLQAQQQKIKELQNLEYNIELIKRDKKINVIEKLLEKLKEENENKDIEIKDLHYILEKNNSVDKHHNLETDIQSLHKELQEKNAKIKNLENLYCSTQNIHLNISKETQTNNTIHEKNIYSKIIPEIPISV